MSSRISRRAFGRKLIPIGDGNSNIDIGVERRILNRFAFGPNTADLTELENTGFGRWHRSQINWQSIDDSALDYSLALLNASSPVNERDTYLREWTAKCLFSKRQLLYRMVDFWENHFSTYFSKTGTIKEEKENDDFKNNAFGTFETMLRTSAFSPCMQRYLDNNTNVASQPNENYAREIMELHTLGVDGGYTEADVAEAARVFTGWGYVVNNSGTPQETAEFRFTPGNHDSGPKTIMGWSTTGYSGDLGLEEGIDFLNYLATHPKTCKRIAGKLCEYFIGDLASSRMRQKIKGQLQRERPLSDILLSLMTYVSGDDASARRKTQDPQEFVLSTLRRLDTPFMSGLTTINNWITLMGKRLFYNHLPTGYAEGRDEWNGAGSQLKRWDFVHELTNNQISSVSVPWVSLTFPGHSFTAHQWNAHIDTLVDRLLDGEIDSVARTNLRAFAAARVTAWAFPITSAFEIWLTRDLVGLILRIPEAGTH